jgi:hypothetical protein
MTRLIDEVQIASGFVPVDTQTASNPGDVVSLKNYAHLTVLFFKAAGTAGDDPVLTFEQATDVAFGTSKNLAVIDEYWRKEGADLTAIGTFTRVTQSASQTVTLSATSAESQGIYVFEIDAADLDVDNGYDCVRVTVADTGSAGAQLGCMLYLLSGARNASDVLPSAIVD